MIFWGVKIGLRVLHAGFGAVSADIYIFESVHILAEQFNQLL